MLITYKQALKLAQQELSNIENLKDFCKNNKLTYNLCVTIKNDKQKKEYPQSIRRILNSCGYKALIILKFEVTKK